MSIDLDSRVDQQEKALEDAVASIKPQLYLENKKIKDSLVVQVNLCYHIGILCANTKALLEECEQESAAQFSSAIKRLIMNSHVKLNSTELKLLAEADEKYIAAKLREIRVRRIKDTAYAVRDTVDSRKYILNNLAKLLVEGSEGYII